jgi:GAF domain-containing protein
MTSPHRPATNPRAHVVAAAAAPYLTRGVEIDELLGALIDTIVRSVEAERGTLYLVEGGRATLSSMIAHLPELERIRLDFGQGLAGWVAQENRSLNIDDPQSDPRFDASFDKKTGFHTRSMLVVPVQDSQGDVIGVLQLLNAASGKFSAHDEQAALELASQAGKVIENTQPLRRGASREPSAARR